LQGKRRHLQTGNLAFGAGFKGSNLLCSQAQPHTLIQKFSSFLWCEAQISSADFVHLAAGAQARERPGRVVATDQDEVAIGGLVSE